MVNEDDQELDSAELIDRQQEIQDEIDNYLMNNDFEAEDIVAMGGDKSSVDNLVGSVGNSPTKTAGIQSTSKMHQLLET